MVRGVALSDIHPSVEAGVNNQDLDGLMALYAPDATMVLPDGSTVTGTEVIREQWAGLLAMKGRMTLRSRYAIEAGDLAILSNEWTFTAGDQTMGATTAEVARRQAEVAGCTSSIIPLRGSSQRSWPRLPRRWRAESAGTG